MELVFSTENTLGTTELDPESGTLDSSRSTFMLCVSLQKMISFESTLHSKWIFLNLTNNICDMWASAYTVLEIFKTSFTLKGN